MVLRCLASPMFPSTSNPRFHLVRNTTIRLCLRGPALNGSGEPDRPSVYSGPFWNQSGTDPNLDQQNSRCSFLDPFGSVPDPLRSVPV